jgi:hypothetical protein
MVFSPLSTSSKYQSRFFAQASATALSDSEHASEEEVGSKSPPSPIKKEHTAAHEKITFGEILVKAGRKGLGGGVPGAIAGVVQVLTLMGLRTVINYQMRYGTTFFKALDVLYKVRASTNTRYGNSLRAHLKWEIRFASFLMLIVALFTGRWHCTLLQWTWFCSHPGTLVSLRQHGCKRWCSCISSEFSSIERLGSWSYNLDWCRNCRDGKDDVDAY